LELLHTAHWLLTYEQPLHLVRATRSSVGFANVEEVEQSWEGFIAASKNLPRTNLRLLLDVREAPLRNDEAFEQALEKYRAEVFAGYEAIAVLVKTAVGMLQVTRINKMRGGSRPIFTDEKAALAYLANAPHGSLSTK